jgi:glycosyltransferase involved in cell wall biosynthesis
LAGATRRIDALHVHLASRGSTYRKLILTALARSLRIPYIVHLHGAYFDRFWRQAGPTLSHAIEHFFEESSAIIVLGSYWENVITSRLPHLQHRIVVLPNATPSRRTERRLSTGRQARITFLGAIGPRKGAFDLLKVLGNLTDLTNWSATVAGDGEVAESLAFATQLGIADRVTVPGWLGPEAVTNLLKQTDIFVLPSYGENLPVVLIEAFSHGISCIATPVGSVPEVIENGRNGLLTPPGDLNALEQALRLLITDAALRRTLGTAARRTHAERYEMGYYIKQLATIWRQVAHEVDL